MYRAARRDKNEKKIIKYLRRAGVFVIQIDEPGIPDLLCAFNAVTFFLEVKSKAGILTPKQTEFFEAWPGEAFIVRGIKDVKEVLRGIMPLYHYKCSSKTCLFEFDLKQRFADDPLKECPACGAELHRVFFPVGVIYRGPGWAAKDIKPDQSRPRKKHLGEE